MLALALGVAAGGAPVLRAAAVRPRRSTIIAATLTKRTRDR